MQEEETTEGPMQTDDTFPSSPSSMSMTQQLAATPEHVPEHVAAHLSNMIPPRSATLPLPPPTSRAPTTSSGGGWQRPGRSKGGSSSSSSGLYSQSIPAARSQLPVRGAGSPAKGLGQSSYVPSRNTHSHVQQYQHSPQSHSASAAGHADTNKRTNPASSNNRPSGLLPQQQHEQQNRPPRPTTSSSSKATSRPPAAAAAPVMATASTPNAQASTRTGAPAEQRANVVSSRDDTGGSASASASSVGLFPQQQQQQQQQGARSTSHISDNRSVKEREILFDSNMATLRRRLEDCTQDTTIGVNALTVAVVEQQNEEEGGGRSATTADSALDCNVPEIFNAQDSVDNKLCSVFNKLLDCDVIIDCMPKIYNNDKELLRLM